MNEQYIDNKLTWPIIMCVCCIGIKITNYSIGITYKLTGVRLNITCIPNRLIRYYKGLVADG
jgi:hypothetical protein